MRNWLVKMQGKYGKYAIPNLPLFVVIIYGLGYLMRNIIPDWVNFVSLNPYAILHGQVWRLISWVFVPEPNSIFWVLISLYFYYVIGKNLERAWGSFYFNVYFFTGLIVTIIGAFALFGVLQIFGQEWLTEINILYEQSYGYACPSIWGGSYAYAMIASSFGMYYINLSIFLGFAMMYPDMKVYLFFIIPIKVKVLGIIYVIILAFNILMGFIHSSWENGLTLLVTIGASLFNTFLFFFLTRKNKVYKTPKEIKRQNEYKAKIKKASNAASRKHKCEICGATEDDGENIVFRFCSKCNGTHEYCQEHLFTHTHIK